MQKWLEQTLIPGVAYLIINTIYATLKIRIISAIDLDKIKDRKMQVVFALWHGRMILPIKYFQKYHFNLMVSSSKDGRLIGSVLEKLGFYIVYGSSSKSPIRALVGAIQRVKEGHNFAITVDGPRGPIHKVKPGTIFLAKKTGVPIVPVHYTCNRSIQFNSWDKYMLPLPFSRSLMLIGEPCYLSDNMNDEIVEQERMSIENKLNDLSIQADKILFDHRS